MAFLVEAADLARELGDSWRLSQILSWQATSARGTDARRTGHRWLRRSARNRGSLVTVFRHSQRSTGPRFVPTACMFSHQDFELGESGNSDSRLRQLIASSSGVILSVESTFFRMTYPRSRNVAN